ncbi:PREDICTED: facilitated trehalose transporter Tret1-like [Papilio xuthus]|uniref:Facilitated trehalose transporter Tret1-like n=1 Tax=Papilio xuthus TaxID=66420 RepID=A0AAJ6ZFM0_PAPXU|nr:PREDICTED: facilitated trehalose transporter Tret1-like [Papilio xuthus]
MFQSPRFRQFVIIGVVNLTIITTGMSLSWSSPVLVKLRNATETPLHRPITDEEGSWIVSIASLCNIFTLSLLGMLQDYIGRKYCVILTCIPKLLMSILFIFVKDVWVLILGRAIIGIADYFLLAIVPVYASEIADKHLRGALCTFLQVFSSIGCILTMSIGPFVSYTTFSILFAVMNLITSIPILFLPDSPYFLFSKGKTDEAIKVLKLIHVSEQVAKEEIITYASSMNNEKVNKVKLIKNPVFIKSLFISVVFAFSTQIVGFTAVSFYLQTILESTKTNVMPEVASVIMSLIQLFASFCSTPATHWFKRRHILIISFSGILIGMVGLGAFFKVKENGNEISGFMNYLPLISLFLVIFCYSAGIGTLLWILVAELFDGPARALGAGISIMFAALGIFISSKYLVALTTAVGPAMTYWCFAVVCALSCLFTFYCIPETKGKTFNEIQIAIAGQKVK